MMLHHLTLIITKATFNYLVKDRLIVFIIALMQQKKISINFYKTKANFCLSLHYNGAESYLYVNKAEICKFKVKDNIMWYNFCLESMSKVFTKDEQSKISLIGAVCDRPYS